MAARNNLLIQDGAMAFDGGVDSIKAPTVRSVHAPNGLGRNQLAWLVNAQTRDAGISPRDGWQNRGSILSLSNALSPLLVNGPVLHQNSIIYEPIDGSAPYIISVIGGHVIQSYPDALPGSAVDLSNLFGLYLLSNQPAVYFCQAEQYLVIQDGSLQTLPLIWDGADLTQSNGLTGITSIGQPEPLVWNFLATIPFIVPAVGSTVTVPLSQPYPGHLGDNVAVSTVIGGAVINIGNFAVITVAPASVTLLANSLNVAAGTVYSLLLTLTFTLILPGMASAPVALGVGQWTVPPVGKNAKLTLVGGMYPGSIGDLITLYNGLSAIGNFKVISFNDLGTLVIRTISSPNIGVAYTAATIGAAVTGIRSFAFAQVSNPSQPSAIAGVGGQFQIWFNSAANGGMAFPAQRWDVVTLKLGAVSVGLFRVIWPNTPNASPAFLYQTTLQTVILNQPQYAGLAVDGQMCSFHLAAPVPNPFDIEVGGGAWTVPAIGNSVSLGLFWNYPNGWHNSQGSLSNAYPGNVGDTVQIIQTSPALIVGTFKVMQFDPFGGITLQTVSTSIAGQVFSGPFYGTMTIVSAASTSGTLISQIPAAGPMAYYQGRIWYAAGDVVSAGDIVGGPSGTSANNFADSVLSVTENPLAFGGDGFKMPLNAGPITGLTATANLNASLGQGLLLVGTPKAIFSLEVPITRLEWISATGSNQPRINVVQLANGWVNQNSLVLVNGDVFYWTMEPAIQSLVSAVRYFQQWGNIQLSSNEQRILAVTNPMLMTSASGIYFNNRLLMTAMPQQQMYPTGTQIIYKAIVPLDFAPISTLEQKLPPNWEGHYEGLQILQLLTGRFGSQERAFIISLSTASAGQIDLWEIVPGTTFENNNQRIQWQAELPAFTAGADYDLKKLVSAKLSFDNIQGQCAIEVDYRPDGSQCWIPWFAWTESAAAAPQATGAVPPPFPLLPLQPGYSVPVALPRPSLVHLNAQKRPSNQGFQFQPRITIKGSCRLRGFVLQMEPMEEKLYDGLPTT